MPHVKNRFTDLFVTRQKRMNERDLQEYVLGKIFPSIRYGQDADLERYVKMRENNHNSTEWNHFYEKLAAKYTDQERKQLIHSMRKNIHNFNLVFSAVILNLYKRLTAALKKRIDSMAREFEHIEEQARAKHHKEHNMLQRVESIIRLCAQNRSDALEGINFLADIATNLSYKQAAIKKIQHLVKGYLDGTLFEEAVAKFEYHFDMKEEYKKQKRLPAAKAGDDIRLKFFITGEDIEQILIDDTRFNEYELSFLYLEKYIELINDPEFATKVYVYSKKHNSPHYHIFDVIRKGVTYSYQKNRVFDDIFKIICQGRYVFNITNERHIDQKLRVLGKPAKPPAPPASFKPKSQSPVIKPPAVAKSRPSRGLAKIRGKKTPPAPGGRLKEAGPKSVPRSLPSIAEMVSDITGDKKISKFLLNEFNRRLPDELAAHLEQSGVQAPANGQKSRQSKDLVSYVLHNYDSILNEESKLTLHKEKIQGMGFSLHTIYTVILNCFNNLKSDFFTGRLKGKMRKSLLRRLKLF